MRSRVTRDGTICAKNCTLDNFNGTNPITGEGIQLRSPTPIMAPAPTRHSLQSRSLRDEYHLNLPRAKYAIGQKKILIDSAAHAWNLLPKWLTSDRQL